MDDNASQLAAKIVKILLNGNKGGRENFNDVVSLLEETLSLSCLVEGSHATDTEHTKHNSV